VVDMRLDWSKVFAFEEGRTPPDRVQMLRSATISRFVARRPEVDRRARRARRLAGSPGPAFPPANGTDG
jgi:hypothetical protein